MRIIEVIEGNKFLPSKLPPLSTPSLSLPMEAHLKKISWRTRPKKPKNVDDFSGSTPTNRSAEDEPVGFNLTTGREVGAE
jgi:hypothetical protein